MMVWGGVCQVICSQIHMDYIKDLEISVGQRLPSNVTKVQRLFC